MTSKTKLKIDKQKYNLIELENIIEEGKKTILTTFFDIGKSLFIIREGDLFQKGYGTFQNYCLEKWDISDRQARNLINAYSVINSLKNGTIVPKIYPQTETQCRPLSKIKNVEDQIKVLDSVHGKINNPNNTVPLSLTEKLIKQTSIELHFLKEPVKKEKDLVSPYQSKMYDKLKEFKTWDSVDEIKSLQVQINIIFFDLIKTFEQQEPEPGPEIIFEDEQDFEQFENEFLKYMEECKVFSKSKDKETRKKNRERGWNTSRYPLFSWTCQNLPERLKEKFEKYFTSGCWSYVMSSSFEALFEINKLNETATSLSPARDEESLARDLYFVLRDSE